ncbi:hypothetical protein HDV00_008206 [Rhizophlyctis rosea]|nr:hypothetical protein HDV00_008206 [Rhizophlyctis rosea]
MSQLMSNHRCQLRLTLNSMQQPCEDKYFPARDDERILDPIVIYDVDFPIAIFDGSDGGDEGAADVSDDNVVGVVGGKDACGVEGHESRVRLEGGGKFCRFVYEH